MFHLSWATPLYILALYGMVRYAMKRKPEGKASFNWSPLEAVGITIFIYFMSQLLIGLILYGLLGLVGWNQLRIEHWLEKNTIGQFIGVLLIEASTVGLLCNFLKRRGSSLKAIGLKGKPTIKEVGYAVLGYVAYFASYLIIITVAKAVIPSLNLDQKQDIGFDSIRNIQLPLVFISLVVLPPLVEEILVRGFLYTGLKQKLPKIIAVVGTSSLFAVAHLQAGNSAPLLWVAAIDTFVLSLFLIKLREKTGRLWSSIFLHSIKNLVAFLSLFVFKIVK